MISDEKRAEIIASLRRCGRAPVTLQLDVATVLNLVSMLQLALRHPRVSAYCEASRAAREFIENFRVQVARCEPLVAELVALGDRPAHDVL